MTHSHRWLAALAILAVTAPLGAQDGPKPKKPKADSAAKIGRATPDSLRVSPLFGSETPLAVTLTANLRQLRGDKEDTAPYRFATMSYTADGKSYTVPMRVKTHGIWRLKHCDLPPLRLNIGNKEAKGTLLHDLQKPKFTSVCRDRDNYEQYVLQEAQLYRIYHLLTPASHKVRVLRVTYADSASGKAEVTRHAFVFEDPDELATRLGGKMLKSKGAGPDDLEPEHATLVYLFEYLIGNTDFSFNGLHNGELVARPNGSPAIPVAYDFDFSGAVNTVYATVDPRLSVKKVRERLFRGYCAYEAELPSAVAKFQAKKDAIYALYSESDPVGKLLDPRIARETLQWYDEFFETIKTPRGMQQNLLSTCLGPRNK